MHASEAYWHHLWRIVRRHPFPDFTARDEAEPFLTRWREPVTRHGDQPGVAPRDPTRRTTADARAELDGLNLT